MKNFGKIECLINLQLKFLSLHLDYFLIKGYYSKELGELFKSDIKQIKRQYQGKEHVRNGTKSKRKPSHRSFENERARYYRKK